jgi:hypothetical protein
MDDRGGRRKAIVVREVERSRLEAEFWRKAYERLVPCRCQYAGHWELPDQGSELPGWEGALARGA